MKAKIVYPGDKVKVSKPSYLLKAKSFIGSIVEKYKGRYDVTPTSDIQVLKTKGLQMLDDVTIAAIEFALQQKDATPSETAQSIMPDSGYDGLSQVDISAIPSNYVGSAVPRRTSADLGAVGRTVDVPSGYYATDAQKAIAYGEALPPSEIIEWGEITGGSDIVSISVNVNATPNISIPGFIQSGTQGTMHIDLKAECPSIQGQTVIPTTVTRQICEQYSFAIGDIFVQGDANLVASNIKKNVSIFGVLGTFAEIERIYSGQVSANTTNTTATNLTTISVGTSAYTKDKLLYVRIRDHAGKRAGYFYGSDTFFMNDNAASGLTNTYNTPTCHYARYTGANEFLGGTGYYGVYGYSIASNGNLVLRTRYNSTNSTTINGTYDVQVFLIDFKFED